MEDLKFYCPSIEEFHVGFEYEENWRDEEEWNQTIFEGDRVEVSVLFTDNYNFDTVRVKYLDKEDIEDSLKCKFICKTDNTIYFEINNWFIEYDLSNHILEIFRDFGNDEFNFKGIVKNKSEFKRIIKQLKVV